VNIVIPMAGRGSRFTDAGYTLPKPLIEVAGRPMYSWAVESLPLDLASRLVFICLAEHLEQYPLASDITARYGQWDPAVIGLNGVTDGQLCTVLEARDALDQDEGLVVFNADTYCKTDLRRTLQELPEGVAGVIGVFRADGDHWSFARVDDEGRVVETAEKRRISDWATTGLYHFTSTREFLRNADAMIARDDRTRGEFYVAPLYNSLIDAGADIRIDIADEVWVLGTPPELAAFEAIQSP
jgi:NDP-sugar pyrophosphorylase family protein